MTEPAELRPVSPLALAGILAAVYVAWLHTGTRSNPPLSYERFRTGLTWNDVRDMLSYEQDAAREAGQYMFVSRGTVLGRWHQLKTEQYNRYLEDYRAANEGLPF